MSEKRYQIFVSSTYSDLKEERLQLLYAILKLNYIPAGMEYFPAIDEEQLEFIKRIIDQSDYYVLLLGARYGSLDSKGISYTEREYDYAVTQGKKVIALIHENPDRIERGKTDKNEDLYNKFIAFRQKVIDAKRLVSFWTDSTNLVLNFQSSLIQTIQRYPAIGWMRGDSLANTETLQKIAALELENQRLKEHIRAIDSAPAITDVKVEACSITAPTGFSETQIECVSLVINVMPGKISDEDLFLNQQGVLPKRILLNFYRDQAIPWFIKIAKTCRIDLRITNSNTHVLKNMCGESYLITYDGVKSLIIPGAQKIEDTPKRPGYGPTFMPKPPETNETTNLILNPYQTKLYAPHNYFTPATDGDIILQRVIYGENIPAPITKKINVHFRIKEIDMDPTELVKIIQGLEIRGQLNAIGIFKFVASVLNKEKEVATTNGTQTALSVQEEGEGNEQQP